MNTNTLTTNGLRAPRTTRPRTISLQVTLLLSNAESIAKSLLGMNNYFLVCVIVALNATHVSAAAKPNVILVMTDDQGYGEVGFQGNQVLKTRLLDAVESQGIKNDTIVIFMSDNGPNSVCFTAGLRAKKGSVYENGFRVPFVIRWPGRIPGGRKIKDPAMHIDLLPTLANACGIEIADSLKLDGQNILPVLTGESSSIPERSLFMQHKGPWRVVNVSNDPSKFELYNIDLDPGAKEDLASQYPERVKTLVSEYEAWFDDVTAELQSTQGMPCPCELNPIQKQAFRFTRQDWWGEKTGWRPNNYGRWRMNNPGLIERFDVTIIPQKQHVGKPSAVKFIWQDKLIEKRFDSTPSKVLLENIWLAEGTDFMEAQLFIGAQMWGVKEVQIEVHGANSDIAAKPYDGSWESLQKMPVPAWFDDGKVGIFIHWGPYSVIGYRKGGEVIPNMCPSKSIAIRNTTTRSLKNAGAQCRPSSATRI